MEGRGVVGVVDRKRKGFGNNGVSAQRWGMFEDAADILGGACYAVCTLVGVGHGACFGGVVRSGTLGGIQGVGFNRARREDGSTRGVALLSGMAELKMANSCRRACISSSLSARKGNVGAG